MTPRRMGSNVVLALAAGSVMLLSGCSSLRDTKPARSGSASATPAPLEQKGTVKPAPEPVIIAPTWSSPSPAAYADALLRLGPAEQEREIERQRIAFARDRSDLRRLYYGMALGLANSGPGARRNVAPILEPLLKESPGRDAEIHALATLVMALAQEQRRGDELERKLEAVKEIERNLSQRERTSPGGSTRP